MWTWFRHKHNAEKIKAIFHKGIDADEKDLTVIWNYFEENGDGLLDVEEIQKLQKFRVEVFKEKALEQCIGDPKAKREINLKARKILRDAHTLWHQLDLDKDGHVQKEEFIRLARHSVLKSPFYHILEGSMRRMEYSSEKFGSEKSLNDMDSKEFSKHEMPTFSSLELRRLSTMGVSEYPLENNRTRSSSLMRDLPSLEELEDRSGRVVVSIKDHGWEGYLDLTYNEKKGAFPTSMKVDLDFGVCYVYRKNIELKLEKTTPEVSHALQLEDALQKPGLSGCKFYHKLALDQLDAGDIASLTLDEMFLLLPWLITEKKLLKAVKRRLDSTRALLRRAHWLRLAKMNMPSAMIDHVGLLSMGASKAFNFFCKRLLQGFNEEDEFFDDKEMHMYSPSWPEVEIMEIKVKKKFDSGNAPALLHCKLLGFQDFKPYPLMFKPDDIRSDMCVTKCFGVFNKIWEMSKPLYEVFTPFAYTFECVPIIESVGVMEFIQGATTLREWDEKILRTLPEEKQRQFVVSAAGSYVACYVLGCRDRHEENFMVKDDCTLLQIDFKRCFDRKASGPVDSPHFAVKVALKEELSRMSFTVRKSKVSGWDIFMRLCWEALKALRGKAMALVKIITGMFAGLNKRKFFKKETIQKWVLHALMLHMADDDAEKQVYSLIVTGLRSWSKFAKNLLHEQAKKMRASQLDSVKIKTSVHTMKKKRNRRTKTFGGEKMSIRAKGLRSPPRLMLRRYTSSPKVQFLKIPKSRTLSLKDGGYNEFDIEQLVTHHLKQREALFYPILETLDLSGNLFGLSGLHLVLSEIRTTYFLKILRVGGIKFGPEGAKAIGEFAEENGILEELDVHSCGIVQNKNYSGFKRLCHSLTSEGCGLLKLDVRDNNLGSQGIDILRNSIKHNFIIQNIDYANNGCNPMSIAVNYLKRRIEQNLNQKRVIMTLRGVNLPHISKEKLYAKVIFPGQASKTTAAVPTRNGEVAWNYTMFFPVRNSTLKTKPTVEIWGEKKNYGHCQIPLSHLHLAQATPPSSDKNLGRSIRTSLRKVSVGGFQDMQDSKADAQIGEEIHKYAIYKNGVAQGTIFISVHEGGDLLGGGIIRAIARYRLPASDKKRKGPKERSLGVTSQIQKAVINGTLIFKVDSDLTQEIDGGNVLNPGTEGRQYTNLTLSYRVGCRLVTRQVEIPIQTFTRIFVGFDEGRDRRGNGGSQSSLRYSRRSSAPSVPSLALLEAMAHMHIEENKDWHARSTHSMHNIHSAVSGENKKRSRERRGSVGSLRSSSHRPNPNEIDYEVIVLGGSNSNVPKILEEKPPRVTRPRGRSLESATSHWGSRIGKGLENHGDSISDGEIELKEIENPWKYVRRHSIRPVRHARKSILLPKATPAKSVSAINVHDVIGMSKPALASKSFSSLQLPMDVKESDDNGSVGADLSDNSEGKSPILNPKLRRPRSAPRRPPRASAYAKKKFDKLTIWIKLCEIFNFINQTSKYDLEGDRLVKFHEGCKGLLPNEILDKIKGKIEQKVPLHAEKEMYRWATDLKLSSAPFASILRRVKGIDMEIKTANPLDFGGRLRSLPEDKNPTLLSTSSARAPELLSTSSARTTELLSTKSARDSTVNSDKYLLSVASSAKGDAKFSGHT
eukprot:CAMPEP_0167762246 /NCGR_PEP_ID=MMETSP0110_2-20121227/12653_1 /TAXON_ID=629695 /ORGANISM="Gymnochlora sp., Strain CCMP2014" /LENGTH=1626 /DNA_ID=CAMNT_0007649083 /DNA_START=62 /DNA_END=4938 /DNA_ORIENTATION=+